MRGIDISNWQRSIDVSATDADFVIVKASEGVDWYDPSYERLANATLDCGKLLGFYHFARQNGWKAEADTFIAAVKPYLGKCILALDFEADAVSNGPSWAEMWMDYVYEQTGVKPIIYMSKSVCRSYDWSDVAAKYELWGAQYGDILPHGWEDEPWTDSYPWGAWGGGYPFIFQYSSVGGIQGYSGNLDKNITNATREKWLEMEGGVEMTQEEFDKLMWNQRFYDGGWGKEGKGTGDQACNVWNVMAWDFQNILETKQAVAKLSAKVDKLSAGGATIDYTKLAKAVADEMAKRMKE